MKWRKTKLAWLAGFFDGEGCVSMFLRRTRIHNGAKHDLLCVSIVNTHKKSMKYLHKTFGGQLYHARPANQKSKSQWIWKMSSPLQDELLPLILPYCVTKRRQIELAIGYRKTVHTSRIGRGRGGPLPDHIVKYRREMKEELTELNRRGRK